MKKNDKLTTTKEDAVKLLLDIGKMVFGSIFLAGVLRGEIPQVMLVIGGFIVALIFCTLGLIWVKRERKNEN